MKTSTKLLLVASALLLSGTSATLAQAIPPSVNGPLVNGAGSIGSNRNLNSALQNTLPYHYARGERQVILDYIASQSTDPLKTGRGRCSHCAEGEE
jgi:hypothetical protein